QAPETPHLAGEEASDLGSEGIDGDEPDRDEQPEDRAGHEDDPEIREDGSTERDVTADHEKAEHDDEVEQALRDDDTDRTRQRDAEAPLHQVGAVEIAELRRDEAVDEPAEQQDPHEIAPLDVRSAF